MEEAKRKHVKKGSRSRSDILVPRFSKRLRMRNLMKNDRSLQASCAPQSFTSKILEGGRWIVRKIKLPELPLLDPAKNGVYQWHNRSGQFSVITVITHLNKVKLPWQRPKNILSRESLLILCPQKVLGKLKQEDRMQEIVAELSAQALCRIVGKDRK